MKSKKFLVVMLIICLIATLSALTSCNSTKNQTEDLSSKLKNKLEAYKTDLNDSANTLSSDAKIENYLVNWAKSKGIKYSKDSAGNVIMTRKTSTSYKDVDPTVIVCTYNHKQFNNYINPIALALYTVKNNESTGKLTVIFSAASENDYSDLESLSSKYFTSKSKVFCIGSAEKGAFSAKSGASSSYKFTKAVSYNSPAYTKAYKITISGLPGGQPDSKVSSYLNPITRLESLLRSLKSSSINFEIANFSGGDDSTLYAKSATVTICVDPNKEESFIEKMDNLTQNFSKKKTDEYPGVKYTYKKVSVPSKVMSTTGCNKLMNFMYTLLDGVYYKDDDDNLVSINSIDYIKTTQSKTIIKSVAYSLDPVNLKEIDRGEETLCTLSGAGFKKTGSVKLWEGSSDSDFAKAVSTAYNEYSTSSLTYTDSVEASSASYIKKLNNKCNIICVTVNDNVVEDCTGTIVQYLINSNTDTTK